MFVNKHTKDRKEDQTTKLLRLFFFAVDRYE